MVLQASGQISLSNIAKEFASPLPYKISNHYRGGLYVAADAGSVNIPSSGTIKFSNFYSSKKIVGPELFFTYSASNLLSRGVIVNGSVSTWYDGNNNAAYDATGFANPVLKQDSELGYYYVDFTRGPYFILPSLNLSTVSSGMTIIAVTRPDNNPSTGSERLVEFSNSSSSSGGIIISRNGTSASNSLFVLNNDSTQNVAVTGTSMWSDSTYPHIQVYSFSNTTANLYMDSLAVRGTGNLTLGAWNTIATSSNFIGRSPSGTEPYFSGRLLELRFYKGTLTNTELQDIYNTLKTTYKIVPYIPSSYTSAKAPIILDALKEVYNDTNTTTLATNGQSVGSWRDTLNANSTFSTNLTTTMRPVYVKGGSSSNTYLDFTVASTGSGSSHFKGLTNQQNMSFTSSGFTMILYKKYLLNPNANLMFNSGFTNTNNQGGWLQINISSGYFGYSFNMGNNNYMNAPSSAAENWDVGNWHVWAVRFRSTGANSSEVVIYRDGVLIKTHTFNFAMMGGTCSQVSLGSYNNSYAPWNVHLRYFGFFDQALPDSEMALLKANLF